MGVDKKLEKMKIFFFLLTFPLFAIAQQEDSECKKGFECVPASGCLHYKKLNNRLKRLQKGSTEYRKIRRELGSLVCNKEKSVVTLQRVPAGFPILMMM